MEGTQSVEASLAASGSNALYESHGLISAEQPLSPFFNDYNRRLETYQRVHVDEHLATRDHTEFAQAGFVYSDRDTLACFHCGVSLGDSGSEDDPFNPIREFGTVHAVILLTLNFKKS